MDKRKLVVEFIGTFFLVFTVGMAVIAPGAEAFAPLAIASMLTVMVYAGGHISGAHYNPAVTFSLLLRGLVSKSEAIGYWIVQITAAVIAALIVGMMKPEMPTEVMNGSLEIIPVFLAEFLFTFALVYVIHNVATAKATEGNSFYGFAIGFTVLAGALTVGGISGGGFNPAVYIGGSIMKIFGWSYFWLYFLAQFTAAAAAAFLFEYLQTGE